MGFEVWGLGFRVWGLGFGIWGLGVEVRGVGFGDLVEGLGSGVYQHVERLHGLALAGREGFPPLLGCRVYDLRARAGSHHEYLLDGGFLE